MNKKIEQPRGCSPTLQAIETSFQNLQLQLELNLSPRLKVRILGEFCIELLLRERVEINHSYYQEILPEMCEYLSQDALEYQPAELLRALHKTLGYIKQTPEIQSTHPSFNKAIDAVTYRAAATAFYINEWKMGLLIVAPELGKLPAFSTLPQLHNMEQLLESELVEGMADGPINLLKSIQGEWKNKIDGFSRREVWIPLVEKWKSSPSDTVLVGRLYPLELDLEERKNNHHQDLIFFNNHPVRLDDLVNYQAQDAIRAARSQHSLLRKTKTNRYSVMFGFPASDHFYSGSSFGFGMSLMSVCALEKEANLRQQHSINRRCVFTGGVDLRGAIRPVNQDSLTAKISAAFFSPLEIFVLPEENLEAGNKIVSELLARYPNKSFMVMGMATINTTLRHGQLVSQKTTPLIKWVKNQLTRSKLLQIFALFLILSFLGVGAINYYADPNPASYEIEGQVISVFNHSGSFLWSLDMGFVPDALIRHQDNEFKYKTFQIADFDMDGETEIIFGTGVKDHEHGGALYFIETDGSVKWIYHDHPKLSFGGNEYSDTYAVSNIYPYKHSDASRYDIYVNFTHRPWFPNRIVRFDVDGNVLNSFIHPGSIYAFELFDLDGDGEVELVVGGTNNRFNTAVVSILPSRKFSGSVPALEDSSCVLDGGEVDSAMVYMRFPRWEEYDFTQTNARSSVSDIYVDEKQGFGLTTNLGDRDGTGSYIYHFTFDLQLDGLAITDGLLSVFQSKFGHSFFEEYNRAEWMQDMSKVEIWRNGSWKTIDLKQALH